MDMQAILSAISTVGFPIAACIAMFVMLDKERDNHKEEMSKVTEALNNNTIALNTLSGKLDKE